MSESARTRGVSQASIEISLQTRIEKLEADRIELVAALRDVTNELAAFDYDEENDAAAEPIRRARTILEKVAS